MKLFVMLVICCAVEAQTISTYAGGGPRSLPALQTFFPGPYGVAVDSTGNVFVSFYSTSQIWKIDTAGNVSRIAGEVYGFSGDGGAALNAAFNQPKGMACDGSGNLYIADSTNHRIRKVSTAGIVTTVAGNGVLGFSGDGGLATSAQLNYPETVAFDNSNNLLIADAGNGRIRSVSPAGVITTIAGNGTAASSGDGGAGTSAGLYFPAGVAVDSTGAIYIAEPEGNRVRKLASGIITTIAGTGAPGYSGDNGPAASATLTSPTGVSFDSFQNLYIVEQFRVRKISAGQNTITTFAGGSTYGDSGDGGSPAAALFYVLHGIAFDNSGNAFLADENTNRLRKISSGVVTAFAGGATATMPGEGRVATDTQLSGSLAFDPSGNLEIGTGGSIRRVLAATRIVTTLAGSGFPGTSPDGTASSGPLSSGFLTVGPDGTQYFIEANDIRKISGGVYSTIVNAAQALGYDGDGGPAISAKTSTPAGLAIGPDGDLYFSDSNNFRIRAVNLSTGIIRTVAGTGVYGFSGDGGLATSAQITFPQTLAFDGVGNLFFADKYNFRIRKIAASTKIISTVMGNGTASFAEGVNATSTGVVYPTALTADSSGNLFFVDQTHLRVREIPVGSNIVSTIAGNGTNNYAGDGSVATATGLYPGLLTTDMLHNLYISNSDRILTLKILNCSFTFSSPIFLANSSGGSGSLSVTASDPSCTYSVSSGSTFVTVTSGASGIGSGTVTFSISANTGALRNATVTLGSSSFTIRQASSPAPNNVGFFQPSGPTWILDANGSGTFDAGDKLYSFGGQPGAIALVGDWNGDGRSKIGYYLNGFWALDYDGDGVFTAADKFYAFGGPGSSYIPFVGDWNGSGTTKIGFYRAGFWVLDTNGDGIFNAGDAFYAFGGNIGEVPLVGDWNGDHRTKIGVYYNGGWVLDYNGNGTFEAADRYYGGFPYLPGDKPVLGDWNGSGTTKIGVYRNGFWILDYNGDGIFQNGVDKFYAYGGNTGDIPIVADWNADGRAKVGVYNSGFWTLDFNGSGTYDQGDRFLAYYGGTNSQPIIGRW